MENNKILAIETSCDDTSVAILQDEHILSLQTHSQIEEHNKFGGVVPELASRLHTENIFTLINKSLFDSNTELKDLKSIVVTKGPGLINTLHVGQTVAKTLSVALKIPLYGINHIEAHAYSPFIGNNYKTIPKIAIVLIVSGGHTIIGIKNNSDFEHLGSTRDDAIGEAYDKVARFVGLPYPGGPHIDSLSFAQNKKIEAPLTLLPNYEFSYSGLKTWTLNKYTKKNRNLILSGFQESAIKQLIYQIKKAINEYKIKTIIVAGGVSANKELRKHLLEIKGVIIHLPKLTYTGDNAAMIGYLYYVKNSMNKIKKEKIDFDAVSKLKK